MITCIVLYIMVGFNKELLFAIISWILDTLQLLAVVVAYYTKMSL